MIQLVASCVFMGLLYQTRLISNKYLMVLGGALVLVTAVVFALTWNAKKIIRLCLGALLTAVMVTGFVFAGGYLTKGMDVLDKITENSVELADIGVYVKNDDPAAAIEDTARYTFGILEVLDRENTDKAVAEIGALLGTEVSVKEYAGLAELMAGLLIADETDTIIMNHAFLDMLAEVEGYEAVAEQLRELHMLQVETVIESVQQDEEELNEEEERGN